MSPILNRIRTYASLLGVLCLLSLLYYNYTGTLFHIVPSFSRRIPVNGYLRASGIVVSPFLGRESENMTNSSEISSNNVTILHNQHVLKPSVGKLLIQPVYILTKRNITEKQKQILDSLTENELAYQHRKRQRFSLSEIAKLKAQSVNETIPVYVDWDTLLKHGNETWNKHYRLSEGRIDRRFRPSISLKERSQMAATLEVFMKACEWANATCFMCGGTLLGTFRHHGFIPWDDDLDILVSASHWKKLYYALLRIPEFTIYARGDDMWKFHMTDLPKTFNYPYKWPCLDVFFYSENTTHIWGTTRTTMDVMSKKTEVFPLLKRPFEHLWVPVPCNARAMVHALFNVDVCISPWWNHKREWGMKSNTVQCRKLHRAFPFVFEIKHANGTVIEILKVGSRIVQTFVSPPACTRS